MHILYFHQHFSTPRGATGTRSYEMAQALLRKDCSVTMVCGRYGQGNTGLEGPFVQGRRRGEVDGIDVVELDLDYGNEMGLLSRAVVFMKFALASIGLALREPADVIFCTTTPLTACIPGIAARWLRRKPFVFEVRDLWPELPRAMGIIRNPITLGILSALEWTAYHSAHRLVGLSPGIVEGIRSRGIDAKLITMIPNGCDPEIFFAPSESWRPEGVGPEKLLAVFAGTHGMANGLGAVLDTAEELRRLGRDDICIVLVGQGSEKSALIARAEREDLRNLVFLDPVPKSRLAGLFAGADLGLQVLKNVPAFYYGTSPNKFFDYLSAGLPVLNNYPGWLAELIQEAQCGLLVPPDDPTAFANALIEAADDRQKLAEMGGRARHLAETQFARSRLSNAWVNWVTGAGGQR